MDHIFQLILKRCVKRHHVFFICLLSHGGYSVSREWVDTHTHTQYKHRKYRHNGKNEKDKEKNYTKREREGVHVHTANTVADAEEEQRVEREKEVPSLPPRFLFLIRYYEKH